MTRLALLAVAAVLAGCASGSDASVSAASVARFQAIGNGLLSIAGSEAVIAGASPATAARIDADAKLAQTALAGLSPGMAQANAAPSALTIRTAAEDALTAAAALPLPASARQVVLALQVLLPVAEASIGVTPTTAPPEASTMSPYAAHAVLQDAPH